MDSFRRVITSLKKLFPPPRDKRKKTQTTGRQLLLAAITRRGRGEEIREGTKKRGSQWGLRTIEKQVKIRGIREGDQSYFPKARAKGVLRRR